MKSLSTCISIIEAFAPPALATFDYVGLLHGESTQKINKIGLTLDYSLQAITQAIDLSCDLLITHHGPTEIAYPLRGNNLEKIRLAASHNLAVYRCHLTLDFCDGGVIDTLCELLKIPATKQSLSYRGILIFGGVNLSTKLAITLDDLVKRAAVLGGNELRIAGPKRLHFKRIAITSGQGFFGEFFDQLHPDMYIAGEFEQEAVKYAEDLGITLVELGHHQSEQSTLPIIAARLEQKIGIPIIPIEIMDTIQTIHLKKEQIC